MSKKTIIPAGYRVTILSWENDADNYKDTIHEGQSKERVEFIIALCKKFRSKNSAKGCFGNMYEASTAEMAPAVKAVLALMEDYRAVLTEVELDILDSEELKEDEDELAYAVQELMTDFLDSGENTTFRVFDGAKVEMIPHEITLEDVSAQFGV